MSYRIDLASAQAKLRHAESHLSTLRTFVDTATSHEQNQLRLGADLDPASGIHIVRISSVPKLAPLAEKASLIVGDIAHNLRSALDHLAWQLACAAAGGAPAKPREVQFPICYPSEISKTCKTPSYFTAADWQKIHEFEPCKGLNGRPDGWSGDYVHQLSLLQQLNNDDKHKTLAVILLVPNQLAMIPTRASLPPWIVKTEDGWEFASERVSDPDPDADMPNFEHASFRAEVGAEVGRFRATAWQGRTTIENVGTATPQVALDERRPAVAAIERLTEYVRLILDSF